MIPAAVILATEDEKLDGTPVIALRRRPESSGCAMARLPARCVRRFQAVIISCVWLKPFEIELVGEVGLRTYFHPGRNQSACQLRIHTVAQPGAPGLSFTRSLELAHAHLVRHSDEPE